MSDSSFLSQKEGIRKVEGMHVRNLGVRDKVYYLDALSPRVEKRKTLHESFPHGQRQLSW